VVSSLESELPLHQFTYLSKRQQIVAGLSRA
jgi:hypothetical protein